MNRQIGIFLTNEPLMDPIQISPCPLKNFLPRDYLVLLQVVATEYDKKHRYSYHKPRHPSLQTLHCVSLQVKEHIFHNNLYSKQKLLRNIHYATNFSPPFVSKVRSKDCPHHSNCCIHQYKIDPHLLGSILSVVYTG